MSVMYIKDLIVEAKHGVHDHEKIHPQRIRINVELTTDTDRASATDDLSDTLDWSQLRQNIIDTVQNNSFNLIERLASEVAEQILHNKDIEKVTVSIDKLDAFESGIPGIKIDI